VTITIQNIVFRLLLRTYHCVAIGDVVHTHLDLLHVEVHLDGVRRQVGATVGTLIGHRLEVDLGLNSLCVIESH